MACSEEQASSSDVGGDTARDPALSSFGRRVQHPSIHQPLVDKFRELRLDRPLSSRPLLEDEVQSIVEEEAAKCCRDMPLKCDFGLVQDLYFSIKTPDYAEIIKVLYWRGRIQLAVWHVFELLSKQGLIDRNCLRTPITFYTVPKPVSQLGRLLSCFEGPTKDRKMTPSLCKYDNKLSAGPLSWLAIIILRGGGDMRKIFEDIAASRLLGKLDKESFAYWQMYSTIKFFGCNPITSADEEIRASYFGFWLPHGVGECGDEEFARRVENCKNRFNRVEKVFLKTFDISQDELYTEEAPEQDPSRKPQKLSWWKRIVEWATVFKVGAMTAVHLTPLHPTLTPEGRRCEKS